MTHPDTVWFTEARFGMFIHWGIYATPARGEWVMNQESIDPVDYRQRYFADFNPDLYSPVVWADLAARAGMRYAVITAKHHDGFCLFDSQFTDYKATNTRAKRDLLKPWAAAFRERGLRTGFYYSLLDWSHPEFVIDRHWGPLRDLPAEEMALRNVDRDMRRYAAYMRNQATELLTNYGDIDVMWFDFTYPNPPDPENPLGPGKGAAEWESETLVKHLRSLRPNILIDDRLGLEGGGDFISPEQFCPRACLTRNGKPALWESCQNLCGHWGYGREGTSWRDSDELIRTLVDTVSKDGNLLLNVGPNARGELCPDTVERLEDIAAWMRYHACTIHGCGSAPAEFVCPPDCRFTWHAPSRTLYVHVFAWPYKHLHLDGLRGKVRDARLLLDGSEIPLRGLGRWQMHTARNAGFGDDLLSLTLPISKPKTAVPVIALRLNE